MTEVGALDQLFADLIEAQNNHADKLPPVEQWHPPLSGDIDIRIGRDGVWYHEGEPITRDSIVKLFASILRREGDEYFLVTPVEKWRLRVDEAPLYVISVQQQARKGLQALLFTTSTDDVVLADSAHPLRVVTNAVDGQPIPLLMVRNQLEGVISRPVYYELATMVEAREIAGQTVQGISSMGVFFPLT